MASSLHRGWRVVSAAHETSAPGLEHCPPADLPEVAVAGRSNVGKSSLLNAFVGQRGLARVSRTPGRTRLLKVFRVELPSPTGQALELRCVDLPGYGYAAAGKQTRRGFGPMVETYLTGRQTLRGLVLLVDARRGFCARDLELLGFMSALGLPTLVTATKSDKLGAAERGLVARRLADAIGARSGDILLTSATTGLGIADEPGSGGLVRDLADLAFGDRDDMQ
jgi:GTP-binding protein